jgi:hypothetical protein
MEAATDDEVPKWLTEIEWNHGIKADGTTLYYPVSSANCIELKFPDTLLRTTYFCKGCFDPGDSG